MHKQYVHIEHIHTHKQYTMYVNRYLYVTSINCVNDVMSLIHSSSSYLQCNTIIWYFSTLNWCSKTTSFECWMDRFPYVRWWFITFLLHSQLRHDGITKQWGLLAQKNAHSMFNGCMNSELSDFLVNNYLKNNPCLH